MLERADTGDSLQKCTSPCRKLQHICNHPFFKLRIHYKDSLCSRRAVWSLILVVIERISLNFTWVYLCFEKCWWEDWWWSIKKIHTCFVNTSEWWMFWNAFKIELLWFTSPPLCLHWDAVRSKKKTKLKPQILICAIISCLFPRIIISPCVIVWSGSCRKENQYETGLCHVNLDPILSQERQFITNGVMRDE